MAEISPGGFEGAWAYIVTGGGAVITALTGAVVTLWKRANKLSDDQNTAVVSALNNNTAALRDNAEVLKQISGAISRMGSEQSVQNERLAGVKDTIDDVERDTRAGAQAVTAMAESMRVVADELRHLATHDRGRQPATGNAGTGRFGPSEGE